MSQIPDQMRPTARVFIRCWRECLEGEWEFAGGAIERDTFFSRWPILIRELRQYGPSGFGRVFQAARLAQPRHLP